MRTGCEKKDNNVVEEKRKKTMAGHVLYRKETPPGDIFTSSSIKTTVPRPIRLIHYDGRAINPVTRCCQYGKK